MKEDITGLGWSETRPFRKASRRPKPRLLVGCDDMPTARASQYHFGARRARDAWRREATFAPASILSLFSELSRFSSEIFQRFCGLSGFRSRPNALRSEFYGVRNQLCCFRDRLSLFRNQFSLLRRRLSRFRNRFSRLRSQFHSVRSELSLIRNEFSPFRNGF